MITGEVFACHRNREIGYDNGSSVLNHSLNHRIKQIISMIKLIFV